MGKPWRIDGSANILEAGQLGGSRPVRSLENSLENVKKEKGYKYFCEANDAPSLTDSSVCNAYMLPCVLVCLCVAVFAWMQESQISRQRRTVVPSVPQNAEQEARSLFAKEVC